MEKLLAWFKKHVWSKSEEFPQGSGSPQEISAEGERPYTDEEAEKVKERLQGLGYLD